MRNNCKKKIVIRDDNKTHGTMIVWHNRCAINLHVALSLTLYLSGCTLVSCFACNTMTEYLRKKMAFYQCFLINYLFLLTNIIEITEDQKIRLFPPRTRNVSILIRHVHLLHLIVHEIDSKQNVAICARVFQKCVPVRCFYASPSETSNFNNTH